MELLPLAVLVMVVAVLSTAHATDITDLPDAASRAELPADGGGRYNRLIHASSPYLLQHATNPVEWYEWGEAAFAKAAEEDKPIFLSVGYSTCHWCHVMARESFEDEAVAKLLNEHFVAIKLDREERPDIDHVYMTFVQATTGHGGWPMSVFLTPERQPFYGGTYFPKPQFVALLEGIARAWDERRDEIERSGERLAGELQRIAGGAGEVDGGMPGAAAVEAFVDAMAQQYDAEEGGFGAAPKFPRPVVFEALLPYAAGHADDRGERAGAMALSTLRAMARGGMYDHLGGGFHRYSVDRYWHVPHFEKMLYDQGQLAAVYTEAWQYSGEQVFADVALDICAYVLRDLRHADGAFYSAEDADSAKPDDPGEHGEGAFYVWTAEELGDLLGDRFPVFASAYGVAVDGNIRPGSDPHGELTGTNQLYRAASDEAVAAEHGLTEEQVAEALRESRSLLLTARSERPRPHLDDKILTAWNGLMISGLARTGAALERDDLVAAAVAAADFIRAELYDAESGGLYRVWRDGRRGDTRAFADDYAFLIRGLLDCYRATHDARHLHWARELQAEMDAAFLDAAGGGWYGTRADEPDVLIRAKEDYDGAEPAPTSVAALNCQRLAVLLGDETLAAHASRALDGSRMLERAPQAAPLLVRALQRELQGERSLVVVGEPAADDTRALLAPFHRSYRPFTSLLLLGTDHREALVAERPWLSAMTTRDGAATAFLCTGQVCQAPTTDPEELAAQLAGEGP